jgi:hypothetical protein
MKLHFRATQWVETESIAFIMTSGEMVKGYEQSWTLEAVPEGSRFTFMERIDLPFGIFGKVIGLFAGKRSRAVVQDMLARLQQLAEAA